MMPGESVKPMSVERLAQVGGESMECTLAMFEHRCLMWLTEEQAKLRPDNSLIALICDAVRLKREYLRATATKELSNGR